MTITYADVIPKTEGDILVRTGDKSVWKVVKKNNYGIIISRLNGSDEELVYFNDCSKYILQNHLETEERNVL